MVLSHTPFIDHRVQFKDWGAMKGTTPFGSLPVLELADGTKLSQQRSVLRFAGKELNLFPTDNLACCQVDMLMDALDDIAAKTNATGQGLEQSEKNAKRAACVAEGGSVFGILQKIDSAGEGGRGANDGWSEATAKALYCLLT